MEVFLKSVSALSDETRVLLLRFIDTYGESCVCDLQASLSMIQSRLSRHLKILKEAGFLRVERKGTWAYYSIRSPLDRFRSEASGTVNHNAQALLESKGQWRERYHSKVIETVLDTPFDLIITVCDHAKESCPVFPKAVKTIHVGFDDPSGMAVEEYEKTYDLIEKELLPIVDRELCQSA
jgi:arsenate reductase